MCVCRGDSISLLSPESPMILPPLGFVLNLQTCFSLLSDVLLPESCSLPRELRSTNSCFLFPPLTLQPSVIWVFFFFFFCLITIMKLNLLRLPSSKNTRYFIGCLWVIQSHWLLPPPGNYFCLSSFLVLLSLWVLLFHLFPSFRSHLQRTFPPLSMLLPGGLIHTCDFNFPLYSSVHQTISGPLAFLGSSPIFLVT